MSIVTSGWAWDSLVWKPNLYQSPFFFDRAILTCSFAFSACSSALRLRTASSSSSGIGGIVVVFNEGGPWLVPPSSRRGGASASNGPSGTVSTTSGATVGGNNCFLSLTTAWRPVTGVLGAGGGVRAAPPSARATTRRARAIWTLSGARDRRARSQCSLSCCRRLTSGGRTLGWTSGGNSYAYFSPCASKTTGRLLGLYASVEPSELSGGLLEVCWGQTGTAPVADKNPFS